MADISKIKLDGGSGEAVEYTLKDTTARNSISSLATVATTGNYSDLTSKLSAGTNVTINGLEISATDTTYSAGEGIEISAANAIGVSSAVEKTSNKITSYSGTATDTQYPSAKLTQDFVNSSIATNTANFRGSHAAETEAEFLVWANQQTKTNNDYAFWIYADKKAWVFNYYLSIPSTETTFTANFSYTSTSTLESCTAIKLYPTSDSSTNVMQYIDTSAQEYAVYKNGTWEDIYAREITFESTPTGDLYTWLTNNAELANNTEYRRYKYSADTQTWTFEYTLNNSSFTSSQWSAINSGISATQVTAIDDHIIDTDNPHEVTYYQTGLTNLYNPRSGDGVWVAKNVQYLYLFSTDSITESGGLGIRMPLNPSNSFNYNIYGPSGSGAISVTKTAIITSTMTTTGAQQAIYNLSQLCSIFNVTDATEIANFKRNFTCTVLSQNSSTISSIIAGWRNDELLLRTVYDVSSGGNLYVTMTYTWGGNKTGT